METLRSKVDRVCDSFNSRRFQVPNAQSKAFTDKLKETQLQIYDSQEMLKNSKLQLKKYLEQINIQDGCPFSLLEIYRLYFLREKHTHILMNQL